MTDYIMRRLILFITAGLLLVGVEGILNETLAQRTHEVQRGETLFSIAQQYENVTVQDLRDWNDLDSDDLSTGQILSLEPQGREDEITHVVEPKETLFSISKQYGVTIPELRSWNNLSGNNLTVGQELTIYRDSADENTGSEEESLVVDTETQRNDYYTVKSGDTLFEIARTHDMTVDELRELNNLGTDNLSIGQQLTVKASSAPPSVSESSTESSPQGKFVTYTIPGSTTLDELLEEFQMDETEFRALNPDTEGSTFQRGQKVTILAPPTRVHENPYVASANVKNLGETTLARYSSSEVGQTTTSGELYNPDALTAAHSNIAIGTIIFVQNPAAGRGIYVRINDRTSGSALKVSEAAWAALDVDSSNSTVTIFQNQ